VHSPAAGCLISQYHRNGRCITSSIKKITPFLRDAEFRQVGAVKILRCLFSYGTDQALPCNPYDGSYPSVTSSYTTVTVFHLMKNSLGNYFFTKVELEKQYRLLSNPLNLFQIPVIEINLSFMVFITVGFLQVGLNTGFY
jgi:hypothetical protein